MIGKVRCQESEFECALSLLQSTHSSALPSKEKASKHPEQSSAAHSLKVSHWVPYLRDITPWFPLSH